MLVTINHFYLKKAISLMQLFWWKYVRLRRTRIIWLNLQFSPRLSRIYKGSFQWPKGFFQVPRLIKGIILLNHWHQWQGDIHRSLWRLSWNNILNFRFLFLCLICRLHWHGLCLVRFLFLKKLLLILGWYGQIWVFVICWCFRICCHCIL